MDYNERRLVERFARQRRKGAMLIVPTVVLLFGGILGLKGLTLPLPAQIPPFAIVAAGGVFLVPTLLLLRCPRCRSLVPLQARACASCSLPTVLDGVTGPPCWRKDDVPKLQAKYQRQQQLLDRWLARRTWIAAGLGVLVATPATLVYSGPTIRFDWMLFAVVTFAVTMLIRASINNVLLLFLWRCPSCAAMLPYYSEVRACGACSLPLEDVDGGGGVRHIDAY